MIREDFSLHQSILAFNSILLVDGIISSPSLTPAQQYKEHKDAHHGDHNPADYFYVLPSSHIPFSKFLESYHVTIGLTC